MSPLNADLDDFDRAMEILTRLLAKRRWKDEQEMAAWIVAMFQIRARQN